MTLDLASFALGFIVAAFIAAAFLAGAFKAVWYLLRMARQQVNLDAVFFETAEKDPTFRRVVVGSAHVVRPDGSIWQNERQSER